MSLQCSCSRITAIINCIGVGLSTRVHCDANTMNKLHYYPHIHVVIIQYIQ